MNTKRLLAKLASVREAELVVLTELKGRTMKEIILDQMDD